MISNIKDAPVAIDKCAEYKYKSVICVLEKQFSGIIDGSSFFENKNIVIKPNLLMKSSPEKSITTHPVVIEAVIDIIKKFKPKSISIAESPGGPYNVAALNTIYRSTGITEVAEKCGVILNTDTSSVQTSNPNGKVCKVFDIISPIVNADVIVNVCKLKTHSLTTMSAATKNLFGTIPGIEKFEMHTRYKDLPMFERMLVDLCTMHLDKKSILSVVDAVYGMEGNGPSGGDKRNYGLLLSSLNPFNVDIACSHIMGIDNEVGYINIAKEYGFCVSDYSELKLNNNINDYVIKDIKLPDTKSLPVLKKLPTIFGGRLNRFFEPRPSVITKKCVGCGECMRSCPAKTIELLTDNNGKKVAKIRDKNCIKCYCCQELCPINAVKVIKNPIFKIIK